MSEKWTLKPHWKDLGMMRFKYHGICTFDFPVFEDGNCYECMFFVDGGCPYLKKEAEEK